VFSPTGTIELNGVAAVSGRSAWAVGDSNGAPLILRWNGTTWNNRARRGCRARTRRGEDGGVIGDRWGVTEGETLRAYPCDEFVASPALQAWRGVHVQARAEAVWPWVAQVRLAPYSYDWIDNLGRRSPRELAGLPEPRAGDRFTTAGGRQLGQIVSVDPGRQLTATIMGTFMSYVLVPLEHDTTRLLLKIAMRASRWAAPALSVGDLIMARRQLLNFKQLAERHQDTPARHHTRPPQACTRRSSDDRRPGISPQRPDRDQQTGAICAPPRRLPSVQLNSRSESAIRPQGRHAANVTRSIWPGRRLAREIRRSARPWRRHQPLIQACRMGHSACLGAGAHVNASESGARAGDYDRLTLIFHGG
jgi:hypothetical protein